MQNMGFCAATGNACPRGSHSSGVHYLEKWYQSTNSDTGALIPWVMPGQSGYINGWKVSRAGWYQVNFLITFNSGSTAANAFAYIVVVTSDKEASIIDSTSANADVIALAGTNAMWLRPYNGATTAAISEATASAILYFPANSILVAYAGVTGAAKTQDTDYIRHGHFSIARVA
jgi:hypothetical protein